MKNYIYSGYDIGDFSPVFIPLNAIELKPNDSHKSFYKKACYIDFGDRINLYSYNTLVLIYEKGKNAITYNRYRHYSRTTDRHIRAFLQNVLGLPAKILD